MSNTIDEKVVEMRFDNKQFEENVQTSISSIDKLKKNLDFSGAEKGLKNIDSTANKIDLSGFTGAIGMVSKKFSAMEIVAITALSRITNSAITAGKNLVKSLSVDQISAGFSKYEGKTKAVQTIISATGLSIEEVDAQLSKLNWFTDETSYNFTDMANNIGKFTAQGIDLATATTAMQGIATWAAKAGQGTNEASRAMYNLSQALGMGSVRLQDWMSIENANMATAEFKQLVIDTAIANGKLKKSWDGTYKTAKGTAVTVETFRSTLSDGWFDSDTLLAVLQQYGGFSEKLYEVTEETGLTASEFLINLEDFQNGTLDMDALMQSTGKSAEELTEILTELSDENMSLGNSSFRAAQEAKTFTDAIEATKDAVSTGWMNTFELIFGNYEQAKELWTDLANAMYDVFASGAEARNELLEIWQLYGGRDDLVQAFWNAWDAIASVVTPIKEAFREIFPATTARNLFLMTRNLRNFTESLILSEDIAKKVKSAFKGLFGVLDIVKQVFAAIYRAIKPLFGPLAELGDKVLTLAANLGESIAEFSKFLKSSTVFETIGEKITTGITAAATAISNFKNKLSEKISLGNFSTLSEIFTKFSTGIANFVSEGSGFSTASAEINTALTNIGLALQNAGNGFQEVGAGIMTIVNTIVGMVFNFGNNIASEIGQTISSICQVIASTAPSIGEAVKAVLLSLIGVFTDCIPALADGLGQLLVAVMHSLVTYAPEFMDSAFTLATEVINKLSDRIPDLIRAGVNLINDVAAGLIDGIRNINWGQIAGLLSTAFGAKLTGGLLSNINNITDILFSALDAIPDLKAKLAEFLKQISGVVSAVKKNVNASTFAKTCASLLKLAIAIGVMAAALYVISKIPSDAVIRALFAMTIVITELVAATKILEKGKSSARKATASLKVMIGMAAAILILAYSLKMLSGLTEDELGRGLVGVGVLITMMVAAAKIMSNGKKKIMKGAGQMILLAAAIKILASVWLSLAKLTWGQMAKGALGVVVLMGVLKVLATTMKTDEKGAVKGAGQMLVTAIAIVALAGVLKSIANLSWEQIAKGLVGLVGCMAIMVGGINAFEAAPGGTGQLIVAAAALLVVAGALKAIGNMEWDQLLKGLLGIGGSLLFLVVALNALKGTAAGAAALLIASVALLVAASALTVFATALGLVAKIGVGKIIGAAAGFAAAMLLIGVTTAILGVISPLILIFAASLKVLAVAMGGLGIGLMLISGGIALLGVGLSALMGALGSGVETVVASLAVIILDVIKLIPDIISVLGDTIQAIADLIITNAPKIAAAITAVLMSCLALLLDNVPAIVDGVFELVTSVLDSLVQNTPQVIDSIMQFLINILNGISARLPELIQAGVNLVVTFFSGIVDALQGFDADVLVKSLAGIGILAVLMGVFSAITPLIPGAMLGVLGLGLVVAELALVLAAVGGLAQIPGLSWLIGEGGNLLQSIGTAIGQFVGGIVGGLLTGISSSFATVGTNLSAFMTNIQPFLSGASSIDDAMLKGVTTLGEMMLVISGITLLDGLTSWLTGGNSLADFGTQLISFGAAMSAFATSISGLDTDAVTNAATAGQALAEMASTIPNCGGVISFFTGENDMATFGLQLVPFGMAMKAYADAVAGLDTEAIVNSATAGSALVELANTVPNCGGVVSFFTGEKDLATFGLQIVPFGMAMKAYADAVSGIDVEAITNSATAGSALVELANTVPNCGGAVAWFTGDNDLATFGAQIVPFGTAMKDYADAVAGMDTDVVTNSANAATALSSLAASLPDTGGLFGWLTGKQDLSTFGDNLSAFGTSFSKYYETISGIDTAKLSAIMTNYNEIITLAGNVEDVDTSGMKTFAKKLAKSGATAIENAVSEFVDIHSGVVAEVKTVMDLCVSAIDGTHTDFIAAGRGVANKFVSGISSKVSSVSSACQRMANAGITAVRNKYNSFVQMGKYFVEGFCEGITTYTYLAEARSRLMAKNAWEAAAEELDEHSPSRVTYQIGEYFGLGFVNALSDYAGDSYNAGAAIASSAKEGLRDAITKISDTIEGGIDAQPTIRPVLDLSDVSSGASRLSALLSRSHAMNIDASMSPDGMSEIQNEPLASSQGNQYSFVQNNYSPKALSRIDIYRQTKNQFSALKGMV